MVPRGLPLVVGSLLCCCGPTAEQEISESLMGLPVESYRLVDCAGLNEAITTAAGQGDAWASDPVDIARRFVGSSGARSMDIWRQDDHGEQADSTTVIIVEDGYLDDSIRGMWHRFRLARSADDTWRIVEVRRAYRCWRGHHLDGYSKELCP